MLACISSDILQFQTLPLNDPERSKKALGFEIMTHTLAPFWEQIQSSQVWRVGRFEDGSAFLHYPIRPENGGGNGLYTSDVRTQQLAFL